MTHDLDFTDQGLLHRRDLWLSDGAITRAVRSGRLRRMYPDVYATAECALGAGAARRRAALLYAGTGARLSCASACAEWGLLQPVNATVHVATHNFQVRPVAWLVPHRKRRWQMTQHHGVPLSSLEDAVVEAFGCMSEVARRELLITAVRERQVLPDKLRAAAHPGTRARPALLALLDDVEGGSHSEGELAVLSLIRRAGLPEPVRQLRVRIGGQAAYLDMAFETQLVSVEADSRKWHFAAAERAADIRRDALLSAAGWVVLRFLYEQIVGEPSWVAERIRATLASRLPIA